MTSEVLHWQVDGEVLRFSGVLDSQSLLCFWAQRHTLLPGKRVLDLTAVTRVDSAGLAMLIHIQNETYGLATIKLIGGSERLSTLIKLYNLNEIMPIE